MNTTPLHRDFGVEIHGLNLKDVTADHLYPEIRAAFEEHSLLLFRGQDWSDDDILRFGALWGKIENRTDGPVHVPKVSNVKSDGSVLLPDALRLKDLQANMMWHTDSTFMPVPALANIITGRVVPSREGTTELVSTRAGFRRLGPALQETLRGAVLRHRLTHSRAKIDPKLTKLDYITKWNDQLWPAIWPNPVNGAEGVYIASHACGIEGMEDGPALALIDEVIAALTPQDAVYSHTWQVDDVLIWDERATLHRGMPWPYEEPRTLASICISAGASDGLDAMQAA